MIYDANGFLSYHIANILLHIPNEKGKSKRKYDVVSNENMCIYVFLIKMLNQPLIA